MIRRWFLAGLLVWIPLGATLLVIRFLFQLLDASLLMVPPSLRPGIAGLGVVLSIVLVLVTGAIASNFLGSKLVSLGERLLNRIPLVRSIYGGVKKLAETLFSQSSSSFRKVVLIEYPRKGIWSVGFQAGDSLPEAKARTGIDYITVFVPTTPNPTSGFIMQVPRSEIVWLEMDVEEGMRYIISLGMVLPDGAQTAPGIPAGSETATIVDQTSRS